MKKLLHTFLTLILLSIPTLVITGCSDEDDLPEVGISVNMDDVSIYNDIIYVVKGDTLKITSLDVYSLTNRSATLTNVGYYWDRTLAYVSNVSPFACDINTAGLPLGNHLLQIKMTVLQVDKSVGISWCNYTVKIVESVGDIPPEAAQPGNVTIKTAQHTE
ncbi:MAG: hypothetical protein NC097_06180 [Clostridium sp.]|nr:hypothetical protein [Prevotella sp.]MCM1429366.1 hypothetical protein [Clostridium sp.]MCM1475599.1 hypothetical protein [Muribaculaceae bacterium]